MANDPNLVEEASPAGATETQRLLWDWPTRFFHWVIAGLFLGGFALAQLAHEHSQSFTLHMVLGLVLALAVVLRLGWGLVGSRPSRLSSFLFSPRALLRYLRDAAKGQDRPSPGHNPGSSYAAYAMLLLPLGLAATGIAQGQGLKEAKDLHEALAYTMVGVIVVHLLGLALYSIRHRENLAMSMVHGRRTLPEASAIPSARPWAGLASLLLLGAGTAMLLRGLDLPGRRLKLPVLGTVLKLGETAQERQPAGMNPEHPEHEEDDRD